MSRLKNSIDPKYPTILFLLTSGYVQNPQGKEPEEMVGTYPQCSYTCSIHASDDLCLIWTITDCFPKGSWINLLSVGRRCHCCILLRVTVSSMKEHLQTICR